ncbi:hypothetical protein RRG08_012247 [Elysia crispata]|uniref:Uncharacterized protein n=1 Tax=Elysia crispata TaxID=231223 RepID=A0AAE0Y9M4_9GAST|nr:hypothetical protein RRG08_012247 [Elysia crispata]
MVKNCPLFFLCDDQGLSGGPSRKKISHYRSFEVTSTSGFKDHAICGSGKGLNLAACSPAIEGKKAGRNKLHSNKTIILYKTSHSTTKLMH